MSKTKVDKKHASAPRVHRLVRRRVEDVALEVCREQGQKFVWYGDPQLCQDIYARAGLTQAKHPLNQIAAVTRTLARSNKWELTGHIEHLGREYPVYTMKSA